MNTSELHATLLQPANIAALHVMFGKKLTEATIRTFIYLLESKFKVYTDNNSLAYVQTSKLGVSQIHWLSKLALFDYNIIYRLGRTNKAADALS